jgi:hypothetical protein
MTITLRENTVRAWWIGGSLALLLAAAFFLAGCHSGDAPPPRIEAESAPAAQNIGERLFVETRFAQYFAAHATGVNEPLAAGDPVVSQVENANGGAMPGPFAGQSINCRSCHFVVEFQGVAGAGNRTYADFTTRSPLPRPLNGFGRTPRNAMQMVGSLQPHAGPTFLHFDGEFTDPVDLVRSTLTGRNFGWAPDQQQEAVAHIAAVIRGDDGNNTPAAEYGCHLPYSTIFLGADPSIPHDCLLPAPYRLDVATATDTEIVDDVSQLIAQYMYGLLFKHDENGNYYASPYDVFLRVNHLPTQPLAGEAPRQYARRLQTLVLALANPVYVDGTYGKFRYHAQPFVFGATELAGLKIFLAAATGAADGSQHAGNCAACHVPPNFTDFRFHNTGVSQEEYDAANGAGAFAALAIPGLAQRNQDFDQYMPVSPLHPNATERFRHPAVPGDPQYADLGLWNVYLNSDIPNPQANLASVICGNPQNCALDQGLASTIAQFKTPTLRDLEDSAPYFHNGSKRTFEDVVRFYIQSSDLARRGLLRNPPPEFQGMSLSDSDVASLVAFLKSLTEDYDDT